MIRLTDLRKTLLPHLAAGRFFPLKMTIMAIFMPIIILSVCTVGLVCYRLAAAQIKQNVYRNMHDTVAQTRNYLDNRLTAVFEQLVALQNNVDSFSFLRRINNGGSDILNPEDYINVNQSLERILSANYSLIDSVLIYFNDGQVQLFKKDYISSGLNFSFDEWRRRFQGSSDDYYWQGLHPNRIFRMRVATPKVISVFKLIGNENSKLRGIILFNLKATFFRQIFRNAQISANGYLALINPEQIMEFKPVTSRYILSHLSMRNLVNQPQLKGRRFETNAQGGRLVVIYDTLRINKWKIAAIFPESDILNKVKFIKYITVIIIIVFIMVALLLSSLLTQIITKPLSLLTDKVKRVEGGDLDTPFDLESRNEIGILNHGIAALINWVKKLLNQVRSEQEMKRQAEFAALQAQINPHFLYNTLDSVKQLCEMNENKTASTMVSALAKFFRISISNGRETISIAEELEHIRNYLIIQQMRYVDDFNYDFQIEPEIMKAEIVKLTLQPLVENAIYHGIKQIRGKGQITVRGYQNDASIIITVEDSGAGIPPEQLARLCHSLATASTEPGPGFGLRNVHQRLYFHYGPNYGLELSSTPGQGTTVRVTIPIIIPKEGTTL
jgi:two-component system sensor histidine kinase YesM